MLAILTTHPIQYQVPLWQALARDGRVPFEVWYLTGEHGEAATMDREFGKSFAWDLDMMSGYPHRYLSVPKNAVVSSFWKCRLREQLRHRLQESGARVLWIQGWQVYAYWQAVHEAGHAGVAVWLRGESNDLASQPTWKRILKSLRLRWLFNRVDRFFYIGSANRRLYEGFGIDETRLFRAPYAVDNDRFCRQAAQFQPSRDELRAKWGIPKTAFCVLFCGKLIPKKRPTDLVKAAAHLRHETQSNIHLLFAGSGQLSAELRASCDVVFDAERPGDDPAKKADLPPASFVGFLNQKEISQAYVAADCLVLPSDHRETWGLVVNEASASGLPCIVSDACGCAEDLVGRRGSFELANIPMLSAKLVEVSRRRVQPPPPPSFADTVGSIVNAYRNRIDHGSFQFAAKQ